MEFAALNPDEVFSFHEPKALSSVVSAMTEADSEREWTVGEITEYAKLVGDGPVIWGSPEKVVYELETWAEETDMDGFNLAAAAVPGTSANISHLLVPELQTADVSRRNTAREACAKSLGDSVRVDPSHAAA
ncbi:hypothetical protein [Glutamicibacter sp. Je.9.36]|uniref:hypothetical protein n=1 Tax=Glutamicibacter sp. Je.9.36 TaxID=3142837 RepID=UPI003DA8C4F5